MENSWKKIALKTLLVLGLSLLILFTAGMLVGALFGDKIKELAIKELNKRLATEVSVKGAIDFSVFSNFPYASITFNAVELKETLPEKNTLLTCEKISLLFNVWDVFGSNYSMKKIIAENGQLLLRINKEGKNNYNIFKSSEGTSGKEFSMKIEEAELTGILIQYDDERSNQHYVFDTRSSTLSGDFSSDNFLLKIQSDLVSKKLSVAGIDYLPDHAIVIDGALEVHLSDNRYDIKDATIQIENNSFSISGNVQSLAAGNQLDLKLAGAELRIEELAALLPAEYASYISHFKSEGSIQFNGTIKGMASATTKPHINIEFGVKNGTLSHDQMKESFKEVNMTGVFSNGASNSLATSYFDLGNFSTSFDGNAVRGTVLFRNFTQPYLDVKLDGEVTLQKIKPLFSSGYITELEGTVTFQQFYFKGAVYQLTSASQLNKIEAGGSFNLKEVKISTDRTSYDHLNGIFDISNNQIVINQLSFNAGKSDLSFTGYVNNFIPYLLTALSDSVKNLHKIGLNIQLTSNTLSWIDLVGTTPANTASKTKVAGDNYSIPSLFYIVTGSVSGTIDKFSYDKFNAASVRGKILFLGNTIYFNDFGLNAEKGSVTANGKLDISSIRRNKLELTAKLDKMDITQLFYEFNNFDQTTLTDKHLKGEISSELALQATWDESKFNKSKLYAVANLTVDNGELNNFEPMMALAKFVKISELKNIRFSKLENQVEIKNQKIHVPQMQILTNALNLQLSGTHSFENIIDYKIQLNLLKLLTSKFEKSSNNPDEFEKSIEGFLNLYLTMTGPANNPVIKYDKKAVKEKISADLKEEKNELKDVLKKEFDLQQRDQQEIKDWKAPEEIEYMEFEEDTLDASLEGDENEISITKENQKKELDNFKNIFKPKSPAPR